MESERVNVLSAAWYSPRSLGLEIVSRVFSFLFCGIRDYERGDGVEKNNNNNAKRALPPLFKSLIANIFEENN